MSPAGLAIDNVSAGYGNVPVLREASLTVPPGELVSLLGPNGAGKSTIQRTVLGLTKITGGRITLDGRDITGEPPHTAATLGICFVPEGRAIFRGMTVAENLQMFANGRLHPEDLERVYGVFQILAERQNQLAGTMSGGQQQMLALSRALVRENKILLLDELSHGLSPVLIDEIFEVVVRLKEETGMGVLLVEQYADRALEIADTVYVLNKGSMVFAGEPCELDAFGVMELYAGGPR